MRKRYKIGLGFLILLSMVACSSKPAEIKINLGSVVFATIYNGPGTNIADSKIGKLNSEEAVSARETLQINKWIVAEASSKTKTEPEFILEDDLGHLFSFYQEQDFVVIEVSKEKMNSVFYKAVSDLTTLKTDTLIPLINGSHLKEAIKKNFFVNVIPDNSDNGCYRSFAMDKTASDSLGNVMKVDSWILSGTNLTELGNFDFVIGAGSSHELYFLNDGVETSVAVSRNDDRTRFYVYQIPLTVYKETKAALIELRTVLQPHPDTLITDAIYTKATVYVLPANSETVKMVELSLTESDNS